MVKDAGSDAGAPEGPVTDVGKTGNLEATIRYLLCTKYTYGHRQWRAQQIGDYLASNEDPNSQWFVFLWEASEGWATWKKAGNHHYLFNACGHDIWVFQWENKDRSSCLSYDVRVRGKAVIREAVTPGGKYTSVRDRIKHASSLDVLFAVVGGWNNNWNFGYTGHTSCGNWVNLVSDTGDDYQVFFFLDPLGRSGL